MSEITIADGQKPIGRIIVKPNGHEAYDAEGRYLCKCGSPQEARAAILRAHREHQAELQRLDDDGGKVPA